MGEKERKTKNEKEVALHGWPVHAEQ